MLEGLVRMEGGDQILPFVRCFYGSPSTYLWKDEMGETKEIPQGEGGEHALCSGPASSTGAFRVACVTARNCLLSSTTSIWLSGASCRCLEDHEEELMAHANISLHLGKTQVWNRSGVVPAGIEEISRAARLVKPDAIVWRGDEELPLAQQGIRVLGAPIGRTEFVVAHLEGKTREHEVLFQRILAVKDTQACWLLLLMCAF